MKRNWKHPFLIALTLLMALISIWSPAGAGHIPSTPVTTTSDVTFQTSGQSMWAPGAGVGPGIDTTRNLLSTFWNESDQSTRDVQHVHVDVPSFITSTTGLGDIDAHFGGQDGGSTAGNIGLSARFSNIGSGSVGVTYPVQVQLTTPGANSFRPGQTVTISSSATLLPGWSLSTTPPQGRVDVIGNFALATSAGAEICFFDCANFDLFSPINISPTRSNIIVTANSTTPVTITPSETPFSGISGTYGLPNVVTTAAIAPDGKSLIANGAHKFVDLGVDLDKWVTFALGVPPLGLTTSIFAGALATYDILDAGANLEMTQFHQFQFTPTVEVSLQLPQAVQFTVRNQFGGSVASGFSSLIKFDAGHSVEIVYPATAQNIFNVTPTFSLRNSFANNTTTTSTQGLQVDALKLTLKVLSVEVIPKISVDETVAKIITNIITALVGGVNSAIDIACHITTLGFGHCHDLIPEEQTVEETVFETITHSIGPVSSPTVDVGTLGPLLHTVIPTSVQTDSVLFDQNRAPWELGGFATFAGAMFTLDPQLPPTARITGPGQVNEGQVASFSGANSSDPDGDALTYAWNFGDGGTATSKDVTHTYVENGTYTVTLTVTDIHSASDSTSLVVTVLNVPPTVTLLTALPNPANEGQVVSFAGAFTDPGTADTHTVLWNFGDGKTATGTLSPTHTYADNGTYTVTLTVTDDDGGAGTRTAFVTVNNVPPTVTVSGSTTVDEGSPLTLNLSAPDAGSADVVTLGVSGLPPGASFSQSSGNPATGTFSWTPAYTQAGSYQGVTINATDDDGGTTNENLTLTVYEKGQPVIAVTNSNDKSVTLIDAQSIQVVGTEAVGKKPVAASFFDVFFDVFTPPAKLYVAEREKKNDDIDDDDHHGKGHNDDEDDDDKSKGTIRVLVGPAAPTFESAFDFATSTLIGVGNRPEGLAVNPDGSQVWVANRNDDSLSIIDRATDAVIATVPLKVLEPPKGKGKSKEKEIGRKPVGVAFSPDGKYAYVVGRNSDNLIVLDAMTYAILASVEVGNKPVALAVSPDGTKVYVANRNSSNVAVVDVSVPSAPVLLALISTGKEPEGLALLNDGTKLYVTSGEKDRVWVFQVLTGTPYLSLLTTVPVGHEPSGIAVTRPGSFIDGDYVYVANRDDNSVSVIDATNDQVVATIPVGKGPKGVAAGIIPTAP